MIGLFLKGGWVMYPLLILSIIGVAVIIERVMYFIAMEKGNLNQAFQKEIEAKVKQGDINGAIELCQTRNNSVSTVICGMLENYQKDRRRLEDLIQEIASVRISMMERFMWLLGITATVAPLMGLLGTVVGIITAFNSVALQGLGKPELMAKGIAEALITTATGLIIAIPAMIIYRYLENYIDNIVAEMEKVSLRFLNIHE